MTSRQPCQWSTGQEQKHFSPLGTKLYFHGNSLRKISMVLTLNMAAMSHGCKPRIVGVKLNWDLKKLTCDKWLGVLKALL